VLGLNLLVDRVGRSSQRSMGLSVPGGAI